MQEILEIESGESPEELALYYELIELNTVFIDDGYVLIQKYESGVPITQSDYIEFESNVKKLTHSFDDLISLEEIEAIESTNTANIAASNSITTIIISTISIIILSMILIIVFSRKLTTSINKIIEVEKKLALQEMSIENQKMIAVGEFATHIIHSMRYPLDILSYALDKIVIKSAHILNDKELEDIEEAKESIDAVTTELKQHVKD